MKKYLSIVLTTISLFFLVTLPVFAEAGVDPCSNANWKGDLDKSGFNKLCYLKVGSGTSDNSLGAIVRNLIIAIFVISTVIALFFLIWGGVRWIVSGGDKAKVDTARSTIVAAIIGLIIIFLSYFILSVVLSIFGLSLTDLKIQPITPTP